MPATARRHRQSPAHREPPPRATPRGLSQPGPFRRRSAVLRRRRPAAVARLKRHGSYANVVATIALFVALGGTSVAALRVGSAQIRDNSVRSVDLRNNDVRSKDVRDGTLTGRDIHDGAITGSDLAGESLGSRSVGDLHRSDFAPGELADPLPQTLPSGRTLTGVFSVAVTGGPGVGRTPITFALPLPAEPDVTYLESGTPPTPECPGSAASPTAARGRLCVYESAHFGVSNVRGVFHPVNGDNFASSRFGTIAFINGQADAATRGTWAVTAP
jgi:hypothetical protein